MGGHQEGCQSPKAEWVKDKGQGEMQGARPRNWDSDLLKESKIWTRIYKKDTLL